MIRVFNVMIFILLVLLAGAIYVAKNDAKHAEARLHQLQAQIAATRGEVQLLENEQAALESPERLARLARTHLGMVPVSEAARRTPEQAVAELQQASTRQLRAVQGLRGDGYEGRSGERK